MKRCQSTHEQPRHQMKRAAITHMRLDMEEIWGQLFAEETDRILSGEITPKILIVGCNTVYVRELLSVFLNSAFIDTELDPELNSLEMIDYGKKNGFTTVILAYREVHIRIISLLNGATADFRIVDFVPRKRMKDRVVPPTNYHPYLIMSGFASSLDVGTERLIRSLFPKVSFSPRSAISFGKVDDHIVFRHDRFYFAKAPEGSDAKYIISHSKECGPQFALKLLAVKKITF